MWSGAVWPGPSHREIASTQLSALTGVDCTHFCNLTSTPLPRGPEAGVPMGRGGSSYQLRLGASLLTSCQAFFSLASSLEAIKMRDELPV